MNTPVYRSAADFSFRPRSSVYWRVDRLLQQINIIQVWLDKEPVSVVCVETTSVLLPNPFTALSSSVVAGSSAWTSVFNVSCSSNITFQNFNFKFKRNLFFFFNFFYPLKFLIPLWLTSCMVTACFNKPSSSLNDWFRYLNRRHIVDILQVTNRLQCYFISNRIFLLCVCCSAATSQHTWLQFCILFERFHSVDHKLAVVWCRGTHGNDDLNLKQTSFSSAYCWASVSQCSSLSTGLLTSIHTIWTVK